MGAQNLLQRALWFVIGFCVVGAIYWIFYSILETTGGHVRIPIIGAIMLPFLAGAGAAIFVPEMLTGRHYRDIHEHRTKPTLPDSVVEPAPTPSGAVSSVASAVGAPLQPGAVPAEPAITSSAGAGDRAALIRKLELKDSPDGAWTWSQVLDELDHAAPGLAEIALKSTGRFMRQKDGLTSVLSGIASRLAFSAGEPNLRGARADNCVAGALRLADRVTAMGGKDPDWVRAIAYSVDSRYRNDVKALAHARQAAEAHPQHNGILGDFYLDGIGGLDKDPELAIRHYDLVPDKKHLDERMARAHWEAGRQDLAIDILIRMIDRKKWASGLFEGLVERAGGSVKDPQVEQLSNDINQSSVTKHLKSNPHLLQAVRDLFTTLAKSAE